MSRRRAGRGLRAALRGAGVDVAIDWRLHARTGIPVTLATLAIAALWLVRVR